MRYRTPTATEQRDTARTEIIRANSIDGFPIRWSRPLRDGGSAGASSAARFRPPAPGYGADTSETRIRRDLEDRRRQFVGLVSAGALGALGSHYLTAVADAQRARAHAWLALLAFDGDRLEDAYGHIWAAHQLERAHGETDTFAGAAEALAPFVPAEIRGTAWVGDIDASVRRLPLEDRHGNPPPAPAAVLPGSLYEARPAVPGTGGAPRAKADSGRVDIYAHQMPEPGGWTSVCYLGALQASGEDWKLLLPDSALQAALRELGIDPWGRNDLPGTARTILTWRRRLGILGKARREESISAALDLQYGRHIRLAWLAASSRIVARREGLLR